MFTVAKKRKARCTVKSTLQPPKERSKPRSISVNKSKENIRLRTRQDHEPDESKLRQKAFISLNEDLEATDKRNYATLNEAEARRRRTPIPRKTKTNNSQTHLHKGQPRKREVVSAMEVKRKSKEKLKPKKPKLVAPPTISRKPRLQISVDDLNGMEFAGGNDHLISVTSSGDIVFSSQLQSKHSLERQPESIAVEHYDHYEVDPNAMLRVMLKREYKKKVTAVIKIQKIWRGYQTRKILQKVICDSFKDYQPREKESSPSEQHYDDFAPMRRQQVNEEPSLSFRTAKLSDYPHEELADCSEIKPVHATNIDNCPIINPNFVPELPQFEESAQEQVKHAKEIETLEPKEIQAVNGPQSEDLNEYDEEDEEEDEVDLHLYRHQRAIYSYEDIHEYLQESQKQRQQQVDDDQEEEGDYYDPNDRFQHEIILETNEEYLDSRKNSVHTKKNRTIESRKTSKDRDDMLEVRKFSKEETQLETRKRSKEFDGNEHNEPGHTQPREPAVALQHATSTQKSQGKHNQNLGTVAMNLLDRGDTMSTKEDYKEEVARLKKDEIEKWDKMITMIKSTMKNGADPATEAILNQIIQQSQDNKKWLEDNLHRDSESTEHRLSTREEEVPSKPRFIFEDAKPERIMSPSEVSKKQPEPASKSMFRRKNLELNIENIECTFKKEATAEFAPGIKSRSDDSHLSKQMEINWNLELQTSNKASTSKKSLKKLWEKKMVDMSTTNLNDIIGVREQMLRQRKESEQEKLRSLLAEKRIQLGEFQQRTNALLEYVENERNEIERARKDIEKGLRVAAQIAVKSQRDARLLGKSIGMSRSADHLKKPHEYVLPFQPQERLIVDEVVPRTRPRNFFCDDSASNSSDNSFINEEELKRYRGDPRFVGNLQLSDMNKNIMIEEFLKSQKTEAYKSNFRKEQSQLVEPRDEPKEPDSLTLRSEGNIIVEALVKKLMVEACYDILVSPSVCETISKKLGAKTSIPRRISREEMFEFIGLVERRMPLNQELLPRLNQQISPAPLELLKCMRVDPQYEEDDFSEDDVGKYQFVIPQYCCTEAIRELQARYKQLEEAVQPVVPTSLEEDLNEDMKVFLQRRDRTWKRRSQEMRTMRHEYFNNEMHCLFDCWNEQIIQIKQMLPGFSGIGLNEATLSLQDHNVKVAVGDVPYYVNRAREKLLDILTDDSDMLHKIEMMSREQICESEGDWIYYTDETLGLLLELDYVICEKFIDEVVRFLLAQQKKTAWQR